MEITKNISKAVAVLKTGGVIVYPTDTVYGLGADCLNAKATAKVYQIKGRRFDKPLTLIAANLKQVKKIAKISGSELKLIKQYWPGPLTILFRLRTQNRELRIISKDGLIGIRIPRNKTARQLAKELGRPITATSANLAGRKESYSAKAVIDQFDNRRIQPGLILDQGKLNKSEVSTIIKLNKKKIEIIRLGKIKINV